MNPVSDVSPPGPPLLLDVRNLRVSFGRKTVVQDVSFAISPGEKLALVGESGSGKTLTALSLLRLLDGAALQGRALFAVILKIKVIWIVLISAIKNFMST